MCGVYTKDIERYPLTDNPLRARANLPQVCHSLNVHVTGEGKDTDSICVERLYKSE